MSTPDRPFLLSESTGGCTDTAVRILSLGVFSLKYQLWSSQNIPENMTAEDYVIATGRPVNMLETTKLSWYLWGLAGRKSQIQ